MYLQFFIVKASIFIIFVIDDHLSISAQVSAYIATIVFTGLLKIGYVSQCIDLHSFGQRNF